MTTVADVAGARGSADQKPGPSRHRPYIQVLRAVAVLMVVAHHADLPTPGGYAGVDVFFVISGFVITLSVAPRFLATGSLKVSSFYVRRWWRLAPASVSFLLIVLAASVVFSSPLSAQWAAIKTALGAMVLSANISLIWESSGYFSTASAFNPLLHVWSLAVEEQFYLVFPVVFLAVAWLVPRGKRLTALWLAFAAIGVVSIALTLLGPSLPMPQRLGELVYGYYGPVGRAWEFTVGVLLAFPLMTASGETRTWPANAAACRAVVGVGAVGLVASCFVLGSDTPYPGLWTVLPVVSCAAVIGAMEYLGGRELAWWSSDGLQGIGDLSYSLYLWHWPCIVFARGLVGDSEVISVAAACASFAPAWLSYVYIEKALRKRHSDVRPTLGWAAASSAAVLVACGAAAAAHTVVPSVPGLGPAVTEASEKSWGQQRGCDTGKPPGPECTVAASGAPVYLVGDSQADQLSDTVVEATAGTRSVSVRVMHGCPLVVDGPWVDRSRVSFAKRCGEHIDATMTWLAGQSPGTVVVANSDMYWSTRSGRGLSFISDGADPLHEPATLRESGEKTIRQIQAMGHTVVLVQPIPSYRYSEFFYNPAGCSAVTLGLGGCSRGVSAAELDEHQGEVRATVAQLAEATGATLLEPRDALCEKGVCRTDALTTVGYHDQNHITPASARELAPLLRTAIGADSTALGADR